MLENYVNKEISWLSFNERVLQEAANPDVPLIERFKFLGICSSNLDEFYRVRVATLRRLTYLGSKAKKYVKEDPEKILKRIINISRQQHHKFDKIFANLTKELKKHNIYLINESKLNKRQGEFVLDYFNSHVRPKLFPIMLNQIEKFPGLKDRIIYFAIELSKSDNKLPVQYAILEIPSLTMPRFLTLPAFNRSTYIIYLDDIIRYGLFKIFYNFEYDTFKAYTIKITRDAELDIDDDISESYLDKINKSLKKRSEGVPVRFIYDSNMPKKLQKKLFKLLNLSENDTIIAGSKYHNNRDLFNFPVIGSNQLRYPSIQALRHPQLINRKDFFKSIQKKDILLHYPYQTFNYIIDLLREASIDPDVLSIKFTVYRVAKNSSIMNALMNAAQNGKDVFVVLELQARFDEESNIYWANKLREQNVHVVFGVPGLKVHSKLCLITRKEKKKKAHYAVIGTGNFNEDTARIYSDHSLLTCDKNLTKDVVKIFDFFGKNYKTHTYRHLIVSPYQTRRKMIQLIKNEISNANKGIESYISLKLNNLVDAEMIKWLYNASQNGVRIKLNVRSMFSLIPGKQDISENIEAVSIVDKFLEHTRIFIFANAGDPLYFISSADWMARNLDRRVEVTCPIYDPDLKKELQTFFDIQWQDNVRARVLNETQDNSVMHNQNAKNVRAKRAIYDYLKSKC